MDNFVFYSIAFVLVHISIGLIFFNLKANSNKNLPPGSTGWPILGESLEIASSPQNFITKRMKLYSSKVFRTSIVGEKVAVFCGANGNKFLFSNENKLVTTWWPKSITKPLNPTEVDNALKNRAAIIRSFTIEMLKPENLKHFVPIMDAMARDHMEKEWTPFEEIKAYPLSREYTFSLACKLFISIERYEDVKELSDAYTQAWAGFYAMPINIPGTVYNRAVKGGKMVRDGLVKIIKQRRKEILEENYNKEYDDLLARLLRAEDENGDFMNDKEICNTIIGLLMASYDTTSSTIIFSLKYLSELPHIYDAVYKEQMKIAKSKAPGELLSWDDIQKMKYLWNVVREAMRLIPPARGGFREPTTDFTFEGYNIPKGWKILWSVFSTHKNPRYFPDPEKFDPSRFEGNGPAPYTFVPFGGGPRMCPGKEYAKMQVLVFIHNVVTRFKLEKLIPNEKILYRAGPVPVKGLPIKIQPHQN